MNRAPSRPQVGAPSKPDAPNLPGNTKTHGTTGVAGLFLERAVRGFEIVIVVLTVALTSVAFAHVGLSLVNASGHPDPVSDLGQ